jgi:hypothetical protein
MDHGQAIFCAGGHRFFAEYMYARRGCADGVFAMEVIGHSYEYGINIGERPVIVLVGVKMLESVFLSKCP